MFEGKRGTLPAFSVLRNYYHACQEPVMPPVIDPSDLAWGIGHRPARGIDDIMLAQPLFAGFSNSSDHPNHPYR